MKPDARSKVPLIHQPFQGCSFRAFPKNFQPVAIRQKFDDAKRVLTALYRLEPSAKHQPGPIAVRIEREFGRMPGGAVVHAEGCWFGSAFARWIQDLRLCLVQPCQIMTAGNKVPD